MNEKESLILQLIKEDPFIAQNTLAEKTGLSRSAVAGYISSLTKQGKLLGRAYVFPSRKHILCVGGANVDRKMQSLQKLQPGTSNPAKSKQTCGGVARNIAENLGRIGCETALLSVVGNDKDGEWLLDTVSGYVDISPSTRIDATTGTYTAVLGADGEMAIALADMAIYDTVDIPFIEKRWGYFAAAETVVMDTNFPAETMAYIIERCQKEKIPLCVVPVSAPKVRNLPESLNGVSWMVINKDEAEALSGISTAITADDAAACILARGVENLVITNGKAGICYYSSRGLSSSISAPRVEVEDVTGAGDSLVAGLIYGFMGGERAMDCCKWGMACSAITLQSNETVNPALNEANLMQAYHHYFSPKGE
ncbi:MAG: carbohydrate kinase [Bacillus sp. (in: firmicutes)]